VAALSSRSKYTAIFIAMAVILCLALLPSKTTSSTVKSLERARQICSACRAYAAHNGGNFPPSLDTLFPTYLTDRIILTSPLKPDEPAGYLYTPGLKSIGATDTVAVEDKFAPALQHVRIVAYLDGSARVLPLQ